ncbi:MAG TPA: dihydrolipoamide acetyltransferase family protein [Acidimicrobiales bacterium]|nr:dihydrolipoamide acetyltransferase family protein [Acidimicrobiales bacterium]
MAEIQMPQLGETVTEGTITKWLKSVGDEISEDEAIVEVSTDKVDSEIPSPVSGTLTEIKVEEGETVDVGTVLALVGDGAAGGGNDGGGADAGSEAEGGGAEEQAQASASSDVPSSGRPEDQGAEAEAKEAEAEAEIDAATEPSGGGQAPEPDTADTAGGGDAAAEADTDAQGPAQAPPPPPSGGSAEGMVLSPVVRRLIAENDLDPASLTGTGAGGRITRSDVLAAVEGGGGGRAPAARPSAPPGAPAGAERPSPAPAAAPAPRTAPARAGESDTSVPFNNIRRRTGEHMVRSAATSPHAYTAMEVDMEGVERVRQAHKQRVRDELGISLTYLPFVTRALVDALAEFPHMNASVGEGELVVHHDVNVGYAVDLGYEGLIVPVVHGAQDLRLPAISRAVADLADRARSRKLSADEISGGTVTITNAGASGTLVQLPIINQPQVMILSTEGVNRRPVVVTDADGNEAIAIRSVGNLTLGWDHRAFDGAYAAAFLRRVVDILETRDWEAEL